LEDSGLIQLQSMNKSIEWFWVEDVLLITKGIRHKDIQDNDVQYDNVRMGYWVKANSLTATIMALKGIIFKRKKQHA
jgi:hypothetical protein